MDVEALAGIKGAVSWDDLPQFSYRRADASTCAKRAFPDLALLLLINVALFLVAFMVLCDRRSDSRVVCRVRTAHRIGIKLIELLFEIPQIPDL